MNIFFAGQVIPHALMNADYREMTRFCDTAANVFYNALLDGLAEDGCRVCAVSAVPNSARTEGVRSLYNCKYFKTGGGIKKHIGIFVETYRELKKWNRANGGEKAVVCNCLRVAQSAAALLFCAMHRVRAVAVVTDVPGYRSTKREDMSFFARLVNSLTRTMLARYDGYVLLAEEMKDVIPGGAKKYCIVEGICGEFMPDTTAARAEKFTVMYAGSLMKKYNIMNLVRAVISLGRDDVVFRIFGKGEAEAEIKALAEEYPCIEFCGSVANDVCVEEERRAHLLVNPRSSDEEYTRYSFPSKNIEYMKTGTPVLFTRLKSMPHEYYEYINIIDDESAEGIKKALEEILDTDYSALEEKALSAKKFIETKKNRRIQAEKVIELIKATGGETE